MTEKEAVNRLNNHTQYYVPTEDLEALDMAIEALEEIQEYWKIGTVEECREAVGKTNIRRIAKKVIHNVCFYECPMCNQPVHEKDCYCSECGQKLAPFK